MLNVGNIIFLMTFLFISTVISVRPQQLPETALPFNQCWEREIDKTIETQVASDNESRIFILNKDGNVKTFDWFSGEQFWNTDTGIVNISKISFDYENLYLKGNTNKSLRIETGLVNVLDNTKTSFETNHLTIKKLSSNFENKTINLKTDLGNVSGDEKGIISLKALASTKNTWKYKAGGKITSIKSHNNKLVVTSLDNFVYLISLSGGEIIWKKRLIGRIKEEPVIFEDYLFVSVIGENAAFLLDFNEGEIISRINLKSDANFIKPLYASKNAVLFETSAGLALFSQANCPEVKTAFHNNEKPPL